MAGSEEETSESRSSSVSSLPASMSFSAPVPPVTALSCSRGRVRGREGRGCARGRSLALGQLSSTRCLTDSTVAVGEKASGPRSPSKSLKRMSNRDVEWVSSLPPTEDSAACGAGSTAIRRELLFLQVRQARAPCARQQCLHARMPCPPHAPSRAPPNTGLDKERSFCTFCSSRSRPALQDQISPGARARACRQSRCRPPSTNPTHACLPRTCCGMSAAGLHLALNAPLPPQAASRLRASCVGARARAESRSALPLQSSPRCRHRRRLVTLSASSREVRCRRRCTAVD